MNLDNLLYNTVWSIDEQKKCLADYFDIKTWKEWKEFSKKWDPRFFRLITSQFPVNFNEVDHSPINLDRFTFEKIAEIKSFNCKHLYLYILKQCKNENISPITKRIHIDKDFFDGKIHKWTETLDLENLDIQLRCAFPGSTLTVHTDLNVNIWGSDESMNDKKFHHLTKSPEGYHAIRLLIALNDWVPGQVVGFENDLWQYKTGDVIAFEWSNARHYTSNVSWNTRAVLKITGITQNPNHWIFQNINNKKISTL